MLTQELPSGTVTLLFTDIEGSTPLFVALGDRMLDVIEQHNGLIMDAASAHGGVQVKAEGDALIIGFSDAAAGIIAALEAQRALRAHPWPDGREIKVRMGLHTGPVHVVGHDYIGVSMAVAARTSAAAHGGQVLLTDEVIAAADGALPADVGFADLGTHGLRGFPEPRRLHELRHPDLPGGHPPPNTLSATEHNLPTPPTPLLGRDDDLTLIAKRLHDARLVTLTGPGGIGKTRLALEAARAQLAYRRGGVWFVELAAITDPADVPAQIARALGVVEQRGVPLLESIAARLSQDPALVVLDNFEQLLDGATVVSDLLAASPTTVVLATSRERLRLRGEHEVAIEPLAVPPETADAEAITAAPAGELFVARASAAAARFDLGDASAAAVARICARCDGIPLAIELAAARVGTMDLGELADQLAATIEPLSEGARDLPARHQALHATIAWSYDALEPDHQRVFRALSVFAGGAPTEAIDVVGPGATEALTVLADRSLLRSAPDRISMLEPIRQFGLARLTEEGERAQAARAHADWFRELASEARAGLTGPDQAPWLDRLDRELDNLRAALSAPEVDQDARLEIAGSIDRFWRVRGYGSEGRAWLQSALMTQGGSPSLRARAEIAAGTLAMVQGDLDAAIAYHEAALERARSIADAPSEADALNGLAPIYAQKGNLPEAQRLSEQALALHQRYGDPDGVAHASSNLGLVKRRQGDLPAARERYEESLRAYREKGDPWMIAVALNRLGDISDLSGDLVEARALYQEGLARLHAIGDRSTAAGLIGNLANLMQKQGDVPAARVLHREVLERARRSGDKRGIALALMNDGAAAGMLGDLDAARTLAQEALGFIREVGEKNIEATVVDNLAAIAFYQGDRPLALTFFEQALTIRREIGDRGGIAESLIKLAWMATDDGDLLRATSLFIESLQVARPTGMTTPLIRSLDGLARARRDLDPAEIVAELLGAGDAARTVTDLARQAKESASREELEAHCREVLGDEAFEQALERGRALSLDQAVARALGED